MAPQIIVATDTMTHEEYAWLCDYYMDQQDWNGAARQ